MTRGRDWAAWGTQPPRARPVGSLGVSALVSMETSEETTATKLTAFTWHRRKEPSHEDD
jgi:hypothetical protein